MGPEPTMLDAWRPSLTSEAGQMGRWAGAVGPSGQHHTGLVGPRAHGTSAPHPPNRRADRAPDEGAQTALSVGMRSTAIGQRVGMPDEPDPRQPAEREEAELPRDEDTLEDRTQEIVPEHIDVLLDPHHDDDTAAEAAEQADPGITGV